MKIHRIWALALLYFVFIFVAGCNGQNSGGCKNDWSNAPAAATPTSINVIAILQRNGPWTNVGANAAGSFEVLPGGLPSGGMQFIFYAPYPVNFDVTLDGVTLPKFEDIPSGQDPAVSGYYRILDMKTQAPSRYTLGVRPPNNKLSKTSYNVTIATVSLNPSFANGTPSHESAPATVMLVAQKVFTITVFKTGSGRGTVESSPPGLLCGADCIFDFGQSMPVQLQASAASGSTFNGWTSTATTCSGTGPCGLTTNGTALTVSADFSGTSTGNMQGCPGAESIAGFTYLGNPDCASNDIAGHPSAILACDAQGYFCCELSQGSNEPRCGGADHRQFPADCMAYGPRASFKDFRGCYTAN